MDGIEKKVLLMPCTSSAFRMGEDMGVGVLGGSQTKSGVPIEHLDYRYIEECNNGKELEKILKVLR